MIIDEDISLENYGNTLEWELANPSNRVLSGVTSLAIPLETLNNYEFQIRAYLEFATGAANASALLYINGDSSAAYSEMQHAIDSGTTHAQSQGTKNGIYMGYVPASTTYICKCKADITALSGKMRFYEGVVTGRRGTALKDKVDFAGVYGTTTDITSFTIASARALTGIIEIWAKKKLNVDLGV
jgi:hypothetical protein